MAAARFLLFLIYLLQFAAFSFSNADNEFIIAGYLPDYRASINLNATLLHLTDVMLFSLTPASVVAGGGSSCCLSKEHFALVRKARSYKLEKTKLSSIRILITIGGGGRSDGFADIVSGSSNTRHSFLHRIVKICRENELDGVDWDNENIQTYEQWEAYLHFLVEASTFLHKHNLLVSVALHPGQYPPAEVCRKVDRVHLMTYDMHNQHSKHHASFKSVNKALSSFSSNGCPSSKLIMGVPAYARHESNPGKVKTYAEIVDEFLSEQDEHDVDAKEIITNLSSWKGYQFDSASDVKVKAEYAKDNDYGGCFLWELGQDKRISDVADGGGVLTEAMSSVLKSDHIISQKKRVDDIMKKGEL